MVEGYQALTEKEKQTLRLLLAGHDAKSLARHFDLSVHTINERLRDARRKLSVSSSREAARLLRQCEEPAPQNEGNSALGAAPRALHAQPAPSPHAAPPTHAPARRVIGGFAMLSLFAAAFLLTPDTPPSPAPPAQAAAETAASRAARAFLMLGDTGRWDEGYAATAASFRAVNTADAWRAASLKARAPLGPVITRTLIDEQDVPAPPAGVRTVRFRTDFANRRGATETVSLDREGDAWKVVGVYIE